MSTAIEVFFITTYALFLILAWDRVMIALERHLDDKKSGGEHRRKSHRFRNWIRYRLAHPWPFPRAFGAHRCAPDRKESRRAMERGLQSV